VVSPDSRFFASPLARAIALVLLTITVLFLRRPDQFLHPDVWVEDGKFILPDFANEGAWTLTKPLAGYFLTATKLISVVAYSLSILWAPEIEQVLIVAFTCLVVLAVALSPTHLRSPFLCAVAVLLIPTESEVFAVSSYAFWWAGVLLLPALLWDGRRGGGWWRASFILVGGLSSPAILPVTLLLGLRALVERTRSEAIAFGLAALVSAIQILGMLSQNVPVAWLKMAPVLPFLIVQTYVGNFFYADHGASIGYAVLLVLIVWAWTVRSRLDFHFVLLCLAFVLLSAMVATRNSAYPFGFFQSLSYAPRYYFYPFIVLAWIMIFMASVSPRVVQIGAAAAFAAALVVAETVPVNGIGLSRRQDPIDWRAHVLACAEADEYAVPIHYIGRADKVWEVRLTGAQCRALLERSVF